MKRSLLLVEANGGPLAVVVVAGANVRDDKLLAATLDAIVVKRPRLTEETTQHLCAWTRATIRAGQGGGEGSGLLRGAHP